MLIRCADCKLCRCLRHFEAAHPLPSPFWTLTPHLDTASVSLPVLAAVPPPLTLERVATCTLDTLALRRHPGPASYSAANSTGPPPSRREEQPPPDSSG